MQHFVIDRALVAHLDHRHPLGLEHLLMQALVGRKTLPHILHWYICTGSKATELFWLAYVFTSIASEDETIL